MNLKQQQSIFHVNAGSILQHVIRNKNGIIKHISRNVKIIISTKKIIVGALVHVFVKMVRILKVLLMLQ